MINFGYKKTGAVCVHNITRLKVDETNYFLSMMKKTFHDNSDSFHFNMNAFISAFRSITLYMQKQYTKCSGFLEWYSNEQIKMSNDQDLKFLIDARNDVIHIKPVNHMTEYEIKIPVSLPIIPGEELLKKIDKINDGEVNKREIEVNIERRFFEKQEQEIIDFCENQLNKLTKLVDECELKFKL